MTERKKDTSTRWDLSSLFNGDDDPEIEKCLAIVKRESYAFINRWKDRSDYLVQPHILRKALDEYERWKRKFGTDGDAGYYFWLRTQQDQSDTGLKARLNKIEEFGRGIENDIQFFHLRIAKIPAKRQRKFLGHPELAQYRHYLEKIFAEARYLLSEPEEKIINLKTHTSYSAWIRMTFGFLSREERVVLGEDGRRSSRTYAELLSLMNSKKRRVRDAAADAFNDILEKYVDVAEAEINAVLANKKVDDELRGVSRPDLSRHIEDDIDSRTVDTLIESVSGRFDIPSRYYDLKARLMKVPRLKYHERNVEYGDCSFEYDSKNAIRLTHRVLESLDPDFASILDLFVSRRCLDIHPRKGKSGGAFCAHHLMDQPTYILLNHTGRLHDVLTLAHELGHGINNELIKKNQHSLDFGTPVSTAEVASTFFEDFVLQEVLSEADDATRLAIYMMKLNDDISTIFRQVACYRYEQALHEEFRKKGYLSKAEIGSIFKRHMASYMGRHVEQSPGSENWWVYWSHIRHFFYVYSYASGLLISKSMQHAYRKDPQFIGRIKTFLGAGMSDSPKNLFLGLGIDLSDRNFWAQGLQEVDDMLKETTRLARRLGRI